MLGALLAGCGAVAARPAGRPAVEHPRSEPPCTGAGCVGWTSEILSGGRVPSQNAVAHERNVRFASRTLGRLGVGSERVHFASGENGRADVQLEEPDPRRRWLLYTTALLASPEADIHDAALVYRAHDLPGARRADLRTVLDGLHESATRATSAGPTGPDLLFYVTDHGQQGDTPSQNVIVLWGRRDLDVPTLGAALDEQPPTRRVVAVMAQCFAGAFAALVHQGGDPSAPLAEHDRCGFFAAPADRPAAGCSPRGDESLYDDYTTRFFAALGGRDRQDAPAPAADADGDGRVSYEEAHFAAITLEQTQDVPVSTSEEMLRQAHPDWLAAASGAEPFSQLLTDARPALRRAAEALLQATQTPPSAGLDSLRGRLEAIETLCWPGLCEADDALTAAKVRAHQALRALEPSVPLLAPPEMLGKLGEAHVASLLDRARSEVEAVVAAERATDEALAASETHTGRLRRLIRLGELQQLERRARAAQDPLWSSVQRVRRCEVSGPWARRAVTPRVAAPASSAR